MVKFAVVGTVSTVNITEAEELAISELLWHGSAWLTQTEVSWHASNEAVSDLDLEKRSVGCHLPCPSWDVLNRFLNFNRMLQTSIRLSYVLSY